MSARKDWQPEKVRSGLNHPVIDGDGHWIEYGPVFAEQAAYLETAREDDEIAERMDAGRRALHQAGKNEIGPYQSPMEDGMQHFHEFLHRELTLAG